MVTPLVDGFGRVHRDLRISVTDRCNFRCSYCMPAEGMTWLPRSEVLSFEEIERLAALMVDRFGVRSIRLTGGEPTMRAHLPVLVAKLVALGVDVALTTNGSTLRQGAHALREAGLRRINISLDSLRPERFAEMTRRDELDTVLDGIDAAVEAGFDPVKVNCVVIRGTNDDEIVDFARFGRDRGVEVRFIEFMPLDADEGWEGSAVVSQAEIVTAIAAVFPLEPVVRGHEPAERFRYLDAGQFAAAGPRGGGRGGGGVGGGGLGGGGVGGGGMVGVIPSVTRPFCESCDRVRLTAEGAMRNCLFALGETDLRGPMRAGATDDELASLMMGNVAEKWAGHSIGKVHFIRPSKSMSQIGG